MPLTASTARKAQDWRFAEDARDFELVTPAVPASDERTAKLLDKIWEVYGKFTGGQLSSLAHAEGTPWHQVWSEHPGMRNMHIANDMIRKHYEEKAAAKNG